MLGKIEGRRRRGSRLDWLDSECEFAQTLGDSEGQAQLCPTLCDPMAYAVHGIL